MKDQFFKPVANATDLTVNAIRILTPKPIRMYRVFEDIATAEEAEKGVRKPRPICKSFNDGKIEEYEVNGRNVDRDENGVMKQKVSYNYVVYHYLSNRILIYGFEQKSIIEAFQELNNRCIAENKTIADLDIRIKRKGTGQMDTEYSIEFDQKGGKPLFEPINQVVLDFYNSCKTQKLINGSKLLSGGYPIEGIALEEVPKKVFLLTEGQEVGLSDFYDALNDDDADKASVILRNLQTKVNAETLILEEIDKESGEVWSVPFHQLKAQLEELRCSF